MNTGRHAALHYMATLPQYRAVDAAQKCGAMMPSHVDLLADAIADALTAEHLSYYVDRGSKTVKV